MSQFNLNKESKRHRCTKCKRVRRQSKMVCQEIKCKNKRDSKWKCVSCKTGRNKKPKRKG